MKKNTSEKKIEANRKNALKSTGPKSAEGKRKASKNNLKHGIFAKEIVIDSGDGKESMAEFEEFLEVVRNDFAPKRSDHVMLVDEIAINYWRPRRVRKYEMGETRKQLNSVAWNEGVSAARRLSSDLSSLPSPKAQFDLQTYPAGVRYLIEVLDEIEQSSREGNKGVTDAELLRLTYFFGVSEESITFRCSIYMTMATDGPTQARENPAEFGDTPEPEACKRVIIHSLQSEKQRLQEIFRELLDRENLALQAHMDSLVLPNDLVLNRVHRYETSLLRNIDWAMKTLARRR